MIIMSKYELEKLINEFNKLRATYGIETKHQLDALYVSNKELHSKMMSMYLTLCYYCK